VTARGAHCGYAPSATIYAAVSVNDPPIAAAIATIAARLAVFTATFAVSIMLLLSTIPQSIAEQLDSNSTCIADSLRRLQEPGQGLFVRIPRPVRATSRART
jgi:hypothetical protein